jgi:hypothetical protein
MMKLARRVGRDDTAVKLIFDHVRNLGISAVVLGAARWKYRTATSGLGFYVDIFIVALLAFAGLFLFFVNAFHGIGKLRKAGLPKWAFRMVKVAYCVIAATVMFSLLWKA